MFAGIASLAEITDTNIFCIACKCSEEGSGLGFQVISSVYDKAGGTTNLNWIQHKWSSQHFHYIKLSILCVTQVLAAASVMGVLQV